jgi:hypothetical protein
MMMRRAALVVSAALGVERTSGIDPGPKALREYLEFIHFIEPEIRAFHDAVLAKCRDAGWVEEPYGPLPPPRRPPRTPLVPVS